MNLTTLALDVEDTDTVTVRPLKDDFFQAPDTYLVRLGDVQIYLSPGQARLLMAHLGTALSLEYAQAKVTS